MKLHNLNHCLLFLTPLILLFASCATVLNGPIQKVTITSDRNIKIISVNKFEYQETDLSDSDHSRSYYVFRSFMPLKVTLQIDSIYKSIVILPKNSLAYWSNICFNYGLGMLIDKDTPKRYAYSHNNHIILKDSSIQLLRCSPIRKNTVNLTLSPSCLNSFNINAVGKRYKSTGILGIEAGLEYYYHKNQYISLIAGAGTDIFGEYLGQGYFRTGTTAYASLRNNKVIGNFNIGYGISASKFRWTEEYRGDSINTMQSLYSTALGFSFSAQYRLGNYISVGAIYQPSIINTNALTSLNYQHFISLNLICKIPLK